MGVDVEELGRTVARLRQQVRTLELESEAQIHDGRSQRSGTIAHSSGAEFDALEMDQYAEIQRISRSLAESLNDLVNIEADLSTQVRKGEQLLQEDMRTTRHIQQDLLDTRLVALTMLVPRLRRLTRQTAGELGKQAVLEVEGEECELDRNLLQNMTAPLEHLIRNAVSHGIETPEEREQQGKPRNGRITLSVSRDDAEIIIRFRDDGRGLDRKQLRQRGLELGLIKAQDTLPDNELDRLILRPGFTTAKSISQIAGRGIGMDVVNSELKALGGSLQIESRPQQGVEFIMRLPFTLIVNPVLLAEVEGQTFALPISGIQGLARISGADLEKALQSEVAQVAFAEERYTLQTLAESLGAPTVPVLVAEEMFPVVFYKLQEYNIAWIIGGIHGRREVVLQPLGVLFKDCRLYSAATLSPDGGVFLVPDMAELARRVNAGHPALSTTATVLDASDGSARVLVVDDSITVRRVTEKFLNSQEFTVSTAKDGMDALEKIGEFLPDVVLLDIEMPRMDGFELLGHLRNDPQWQGLPVVMISSRTAQRHREHAMSLGASGFLGKPYQNEILLSTLQNLLHQGHANDGERVSV
jgi:chemosensory pili system protein ChpA (sensor histidine kinase/response regulator)